MASFLTLPQNPRRRFLWLTFIILLPVSLLAIVAARSIRYETLAVREEAIHKAGELCEWASAQSQKLYCPARELIALLPHASLDELKRSPLLNPQSPEDDLLVRLAKLEQYAGHGLQACVLDREGALVYPAPSGTRNEEAWAEVRKLHDVSRQLYALQASDPAGDAFKPANLFRFVKLDVVWYLWRFEQREAGYQLLFALPEKDFLKMAAKILDPRQAGMLSSVKTALFGPGYADDFVAAPAPFEDYMQMAVFIGGTDWLLYAARDGNIIRKVTSTGGRANERSELKWAEWDGPRVLAELGAGVSYIGPWAPVRFANGPTDDSQFFRFIVSVHDQKLLLAEVRRKTWLFCVLIAAACLSASVGLCAAWRALAEETRLSSLKTNFISSVSHELRTPLASVRLMAESLQRGTVTTPEKTAEYYRLIVQECRRVSGLVENVLDLSRIERGEKSYTREWCQLDRLCRETVAALDLFAAERKVRLAFTEYGTPRPVQCDASAIQQILVNLIDNAVKHSPAGETVTVELHFEASAIRLVVADSGPGIPPAERAQIFAPFYRRGTELRRETTGVGLGLAIVKHAADGHGGTITVEDNTPAGSRFVVVLPAPAESTQAAATTP